MTPDRLCFLKLKIEAGGGTETIINQLNQEKIH